MNKSRNLLHVLGALSLSGWIALAIASHRLERPLGFFLGIMAWEWGLFLAASRVVANEEARRMLRPILIWATAFLVCAFFARPMMEDDHFRFLWDGWQFATTGNPYNAAPSVSFGDSGVPEKFQGILDQINYPHVPTVYGPLCQLSFLFAYLIAPAELWPWKMLALMMALALLAFVYAVVKQLPSHTGTAWNRSPSRAIHLAGWCPLLIFEVGFNAHPDILGITLLSAAWLLRLRGGELLCGILLGGAVATKIFALFLAPFLLGRSRTGWTGFAATLVCLYLPFWAQGSAADVSGLMTLAKDWEFNSSVYAIAQWSFGATLARVTCGALFLAAWLFFLWRWNTRCLYQGAPVDPPGAAIYGAFFLFSATVNPWYLLWLLPFVALRPSITALAAMGLVGLSYVTGLNLGNPNLGNFAHPEWVRLVECGGIALVAAFELRRERMHVKRVLDAAVTVNV